MRKTKEEQIRNGERPENTEYDKMRWDSMKLRRNGMYGQPKFIPSETIFQGTCLKCVFNQGEHTCSS
jgi:hypothetical protein